jgi:hypothetical protein
MEVGLCNLVDGYHRNTGICFALEKMEAVHSSKTWVIFNKYPCQISHPIVDWFTNYYYQTEG